MDLTHYLTKARQGKYAIGHFNFASADVLRAIVEGAREADAPAVMVGTSEHEAQFLGMGEAVALVDAMRDETGFPIFLNADHFRTFDACKAALDAGYDTVLFDGGRLPYEDNVEIAADVWNYAQNSRGSIQVEGELGYLKGASEVQKSVKIGPDDFTKPDEAVDFVKRTGVQRLAVVFGNIHGIVTEQDEKLDIDHFKKIVEVLPETFLVLHGASGLKDSDVRAAVKAGIVNVHYNTELRVAYAKELEKELAKEPLETTPYKYMEPAAAKVKALVMAKCRMLKGK